MQIVAEFVTSVVDATDFPRDLLPEIALVGRSNVGKSSLINALVRRPLARTSAAPGKTRLVNFYRVRRGTAQAFHLVDLPGYGYARGGHSAVQEFDRLTERYFSRTDGNTIAVVLLVDSRHPGLEPDLEAWAWLRSLARPVGVIGTKVDKLTRAARVRHGRELESSFEAPVPLVSATTGEGLEELWKMIVRLQRQTAA